MKSNNSNYYKIIIQDKCGAGEMDSRTQLKNKILLK